MLRRLFVHPFFCTRFVEHRRRRQQRQQLKARNDWAVQFTREYSSCAIGQGASRDDADGVTEFQRLLPVSSHSNTIASRLQTTVLTGSQSMKQLNDHHRQPPVMTMMMMHSTTLNGKALVVHASDTKMNGTSVELNSSTRNTAVVFDAASMADIDDSDDVEIVV